MRGSAAAILLLALLPAADCMAQEGAGELDTDRPDATESPLTVPRGAIQFEGGIVLDRDVVLDGARSRRSCSTITLPGTLIRYGLSDVAELRVGFDYGVSAYRVDCPTCTVPAPVESGTELMGAISLGGKVALFSGEAGALGVIAGIEAAPDHADRFSPEITVAARHPVSDHLELACNVGGAWDRTLDVVAWSYTSSLGVEVSESIDSFVELFGEAARGRLPAHVIDAGIALASGPNVRFDVAGGIGLTDAASDYFVTVGVSFRLLPEREEH